MSEGDHARPLAGRTKAHAARDGGEAAPVWHPSNEQRLGRMVTPGRPMNQAVLGDRITSCRVAAELSQGGLARALGRAQGVVSRWERGQLEPRLPDLAAIARVLDTDVSSLVADLVEAPGRRRSGRRSDVDARRRVGRILRDARERSGRDRISVARQVGWSVRRLRKVEEGIEPGLVGLLRLTDALGISMVRLGTASLDSREDPPRVPEDTELLV